MPRWENEGTGGFRNGSIGGGVGIGVAGEVGVLTVSSQKK